MATSTIPSIINMIYPVGSIYMSVNDVDPAALFGGTWARISGRFLLAASTTDGGTATPQNRLNGATGGLASVALSIANMPAHNHGKITLTGSYRFRGYAGAGAVGAGQKGIVKEFTTADNTYTAFGQHNSTKYKSQQMNLDASHTHTTQGSGTAHENMPPYLAVNVWKRTA